MDSLMPKSSTEIARGRTRKYLILEENCMLCRTMPFWYEQSLEPRTKNMFLCFENLHSYADRTKKTRRYLVRFTLDVGEVGRCVMRDCRDVIRNANVELITAPPGGNGNEYLPDGDLRPLASVIHEPCLQLARRHLPHLNVRVLCAFAQATRNIAPTRYVPPNLMLAARGMVPQGPIHFAGMGESPLADVLARVSALPAELQSEIYVNLSPGMFTSLSFTIKSIRWIREFVGALLKPIRPCMKHIVMPSAESGPKKDGKKKGKGRAPSSSSAAAPSEFTFLGARTIPIFGDLCLTEIGVDPAVQYEQTISISEQGRSGEIEGVQYTLSQAGICGLRLQYRDGSCSQWLGSNQMSGWIGITPMRDLRSLMWLSDGIKIQTIVADPAREPRPGGGDEDPPQLLWDTDLRFPRGSVFGFVDLSPLPVAPIRYHRNKTLARLLPFNTQPTRRHSITVYCGAGGVHSIQVDDDRDNGLGYPAGCSITYFMDAGEIVDSLYVVTRRSRNIEEAQGPYLLMKTSEERWLYYGPYIMPSTPTTQAHFSVFGHEDTHTVKGIFTDPLSVYQGVNKFTGVALEPRRKKEYGDDDDDNDVRGAQSRRPRVRIPERTNPTMFLTSNPWTAFISYSVFAGASRLFAQTRGDRCEGLLADFGDDAVPVTAGQWTANHPGGLFFDADQHGGSLRTLTFIYSGPVNVVDFHGNTAPPAVYIKRVVANMPKRPEEDHCYWEDLTQPLAWSFTNQYDFLELNVPTLRRDHIVQENAVPCTTAL